jgi:hypothetical protein
LSFGSKQRRRSVVEESNYQTAPFGNTLAAAERERRRAQLRRNRRQFRVKVQTDTSSSLSSQCSEGSGAMLFRCIPTMAASEAELDELVEVCSFFFFVQIVCPRSDLNAHLTNHGQSNLSLVQLRRRCATRLRSIDIVVVIATDSAVVFTNSLVQLITQTLRHTVAIDTRIDVEQGYPFLRAVTLTHVLISLTNVHIFSGFLLQTLRHTVAIDTPIDVEQGYPLLHAVTRAFPSAFMTQVGLIFFRGVFCSLVIRVALRYCYL